MKRAALGIAIAILLSTPVLAQSVKLIGEFRSWSAYSSTEQTGAVCFALSRPTEITPQPDGFTEAYLYLTHRPAEHLTNELSHRGHRAPPSSAGGLWSSLCCTTSSGSRFFPQRNE